MTESTGSQAKLAADGAANAGGSLTVTNLTSNQKNVARNRAESLVNAWGIVQFDGKFWISSSPIDKKTGKIRATAAILDGKGVPSTGVPASGAIDLGEDTVTGVAVTGAKADDTAFLIHTKKGCKPKPAQLVFASEGGKLIAVNTALSTETGFVVADQSREGAIYKGVAVVPATEGQHGKHGPLILAADFGETPHVDVFNDRFQLVDKKTISFDAQFGDDFGPFNVMMLEGKVFVTYAKRDLQHPGEELPDGGFVVAFDTSGNILGLAKDGSLKAPWGLAPAGDFGPFHNALLVANFADGHITAIEMPTKPTMGNVPTLEQLGQLTDRSGAPIAIDGLWGLSLGDAVEKTRPDGLYFAAGPDEETNGLFGVIAPRSSHY